MSERMSDDLWERMKRQLGSHNEDKKEDATYAVEQEAIRARASESALLARVAELEGRDQWIPRTGKPACPGQYLVAMWPRGATGQMVMPPTLALLQWDSTRWVGDYSRWTVDCHYRLPHVHYEVEA